MKRRLMKMAGCLLVASLLTTGLFTEIEDQNDDEDEDENEDEDEDD